jgi:hypothetical protein
MYDFKWYISKKTIRGVATLGLSSHVPMHKFDNIFFYKSMLHFPIGIRL